MFGFIGKFFTSVAFAVTVFFGGHATSPAQPVNIVTDNQVVVASTTIPNTPSATAKVNTKQTQVQTITPPVQSKIQSNATNSNTNLAIEKCKAENANWLAAWPALEQAIRDKVRNDYQNTLWSYAQQYKGTMTAGDIASSSSSSEVRMEQQAVSAAKTKFDLSGNEAYQKCLSLIR